MALKKRKVYEFDIVDVAFGGKGLAKPDGFSVFVDRCIPGDRVLAKVTKKKKSWAVARLIQILSPSTLRRTGKCQYSNYCGGCKWQQIPYAQQLLYKKRHVVESMQHIGRLKDVNVMAVLAAEKIYEYRNKMEFSCASKRWLLPEELEDQNIRKDFGIGLHVPGTFDKVIDIKKCEIMPALGNEILEDVRQFIKGSRLPAYHLRNHEGFWRFLMLRHSVAYDTWMVNIVTKAKKMDVVQSLAVRLSQKYPQIESIMYNITDVRSGVSAGKEEICIYGQDHIREKLGGYEFEISANSFFQTNTRACEKLYSTVEDYAALTGKDVVIDLYSGTGTIPIWLAKNASVVYGIEIAETAVLDARKNVKLNHIQNCEFLLGDITEVLPKIDQQPDVMIIDPPRVGMHKDVVKQVMDTGPEKIVYVSCNPSTLARDYEMLSSHYGVKKIQPVDMFPHTCHIESVALMTKKQTGYKEL